MHILQLFRIVQAASVCAALESVSQVIVFIRYSCLRRVSDTLLGHFRKRSQEPAVSLSLSLPLSLTLCVCAFTALLDGNKMLLPPHCAGVCELLKAHSAVLLG